MQISFAHRGKQFSADLAHPISLAIPVRDGLENPNCFWAPPVEFAPVRAGDFVGSTAEGGVVNFFNVRLNPHGNGTHTECVGHIARERFVLPDALGQFHFLAKLVSIWPRRTDDGDRVIFREQLEEIFSENEAEALIIRTLPNDASKLTRQYSGTNPPYLHHEAAQFLADAGLEHLLLDLPSVDREEDGGLLLAHKAFWKYPFATRTSATITELVFVPDSAADGLYLLNLQVPNFELDAAPSQPILYPLA